MTSGSTGIPPLIVMGVSGSGKTTVGTRLAADLGATFIDADDLHSAENKDWMRAGNPLDDARRTAWLTSVGEAIASALARGEQVVAACSALKRAHRDVLVSIVPGAVFVHLIGSRDLIAERVKDRVHEYMPASLVGSQFDILEPPGEDEPHIDIDVRLTPQRIVETVEDWISRSRP